MVRVPKGVASYCTTSGEHGLGEVKQLYGVNTKHSEKELMPKVKAKMEERKNPTSKPWDEKKIILTGCFLIEERENDFYCNYYEGIRGRMCEHTIGMHFQQKSGKISLTEDVRSLPEKDYREVQAAAHCPRPASPGALPVKLSIKDILTYQFAAIKIFRV